MKFFRVFLLGWFLALVFSNNRLIWGQVFFLPEARILGHDRDVLWNDTQVFETREAYSKFRKAVSEFYRVWKGTAVNLLINYL